MHTNLAGSYSSINSSSLFDFNASYQSITNSSYSPISSTQPIDLFASSNTIKVKPLLPDPPVFYRPPTYQPYFPRQTSQNLTISLQSHGSPSSPHLSSAPKWIKPETTSNAIGSHSRRTQSYSFQPITTPQPTTSSSSINSNFDFSSTKSIPDFVQALKQKYERETQTKKQFTLAEIQREFGFKPMSTSDSRSTPSRYIPTAQQDAQKLNIQFSPSQTNTVVPITNTTTPHILSSLESTKNTEETLLDEQSAPPVQLEVRLTRANSTVKSILKKHSPSPIKYTQNYKDQNIPTRQRIYTSEFKMPSSIDQKQPTTAEAAAAATETIPAPSSSSSSSSDSNQTNDTQPAMRSHRSQSLFVSPKKVQFSPMISSTQEFFTSTTTLPSSTKASSSANKFSKFYSAFKEQLGSSSSITTSTSAFPTSSTIFSTTPKSSE